MRVLAGLVPPEAFSGVDASFLRVSWGCPSVCVRTLDARPTGSGPTQQPHSTSAPLSGEEA